MPIPFIPILAAGASALGAYLQNKSQQKAAQKQMDFQERMSSTAYQRATADMKMSGINPMLAYQQGGASSPGGAQANVQDVVGPAVSSAQGAGRLGAELRNMHLSGELLKSQKLQAENQAVASWSAAMEAKARTAEMGYSYGDNGQFFQGELRRLRPDEYGLGASARAQELSLRGFETQRAGAQADVYRGKFGKSLEYIRAAREAVFGGGGLFRGMPIGGR